MIFNVKSMILIILFLAVAGTAYYFYEQNKNTQALLSNPTKTEDGEVNKLVEEISKLMVLPEGETPTLVSVVDKEKVKDQPFFAKAENGDKVLVYSAAKKAILYRPSSKKIIEVGPVDIAPEANLQVALYNTTNDKNLLTTTEKLLTGQVTNLDFPIKEDLTYNTSQTIVVDLRGDKKTEAEQLAKLLGGNVSSLPSGLKKPASDFMIILAE